MALGKTHACRGCDRTLPRSAFKQNKKGHIKSRCLRCTREYQKSWHEKNPGYMRRRAYGIEPEGFERLLAQQGGACGICRTTNPGARGWQVDHDHSCCPRGKTCGGCVRGVLCQPCNTSLGGFGDSKATLVSAIRYLESH